MASIPLPALHVNPQPDPSEGIQRMIALKGMLAQQAQQQALMPGQIEQQKQQLQAAQLENQTRQQALASQKAHTAAWQQWDGKDPKKLSDLIIKNGGTADDAMQMQKVVMQQQSEALDLVAKQGGEAKRQADLMLGAKDVLDKAKPEERAGLWPQVIGNLQKQGVDVSQLPQQYPGDENYKALGNMVQFHSMNVEQAFKQAEAAKNTAQANKANVETDLLKKYGTGAQADAQARFLDQQQRLGKQLSPEDSAWLNSYKEMKTLGTRLSLSANMGNKQSARADKSYQFNSSQLEKVAQPIDQAIARMSRLKDTIAQNSPQADALVAPELLTAMAGGQGSGLRMNEAEISRIVGGRSHWQNLQAAINKWSLDPKAALSITPEQRQQIRALVNEVDGKLQAKQAALDEARQGLLDSEDPLEHRRIVANARSKMTAIDQGGGGASASISGGSGVIYARDPQGKLHQAPAGTALPAGWKLENK